MSTTMVNIMVDSWHREVQPMASRAGAEGQRHLLVATMLARVWFQLPVPCAAVAENFVSPSTLCDCSLPHFFTTCYIMYKIQDW